MSKYEEEKIQEAFVNRFNELKSLNQLIPCCLYSNRNENNQSGFKGIASGARYKRMGRFPGVPDLTIIYNDNSIAYIEVKTPKAHRTKKGADTKKKGMEDSQIDFYNNFIEPFNIPFTVASTVDDFDAFIGFLKKL